MTIKRGTSGLRDLARVASGVSLVVNELLAKSSAVERLKGGDIVGSTTAALKFVQNTVADATGLTQGRLRTYPSNFATRTSSPLNVFENNSEAEIHVAEDSKPCKSDSGFGFVVDKTSHGSKSKPESGFINGEKSEGYGAYSETDGMVMVASPSEAEEQSRLSGSCVDHDSQDLATKASEETSGEAERRLRAELLKATCVSGRAEFSAVRETLLDDGRVSPETSKSVDPADGQPFAIVLGTTEDKREVPSTTAKDVAGGHVDSGDSAVGLGTQQVPVIKKRKSRQRRVPATPLGRVLGFAGLGAGLAWGSFQESARRLWGGQGSTPSGKSVLSPFMTEQNAERLAVALCRMRGAALKVGQMLSIQDESLVPAPVLAALESVRQSADVMPQRQLNKVLDSELGPGWRERLLSFDEEPIAAASIGQVHRAVLKDGREVAMKVQYPGVAASIDSDIENVRLLLDYTNLIPEGLYLDQAMRVAKEELRRECDYEHEAINQKRFRKLLDGEEGFHVPLVIDEFSTRGVLTSELVSGVPIDQVAMMDQQIRNHVGTKLLSLTLQELFTFRFMQTDPNWGNFLYAESTNIINLIDFGAARDFPKQFVDDYLRMVLACANRDRDQIIEISIRLGFLTGKEETEMLDAHTEAAYATGEPFSKSGTFDFHNSILPKRISELGATILRHRLTPPPDEAYSLHRKLSGAFLACVKLSASVPCREILLQEYNRYKPELVETSKVASA